MKIKTHFPVALVAVSMLASPVLAQEADDAAERAAEADATRMQQQQGSLRGGTRDPLDPVSLPARQGVQAVGNSPTAFNPMVSVILDGVFYADDVDGEAGEIVSEAPGFGGGHGHGHGHGHGGLGEGFNIRETEFTFSATVDPYFDAVAVLALEGTDEVELEEVYGVTRALPGGLQVKFGRFLSDVGYINKQHPHSWNFVDRPLVSELLFGDHGIQENGVQLSWVAPTRSYTRLGLEALQGETSQIASYVGEGHYEIDTFVTADGTNNGAGEVCEGLADGAPCRVSSEMEYELEAASGPRLFTGFAKWAPDLGFDHALQLGVSGGYSRAFQRVEEHSDGELETWDGDTWFAGLDMVYKYDAGRSFGHGNLTLQGEYFYRERDVHYVKRAFDDFGEDTFDLEDDMDQTHRQDGLYVQALYGIAPRWMTGLRYDGIGFRNRAYEGADRIDADTSHRYTANLSFLPTEFSRLRLQFARGDMDHEAGADHEHEFNQVMLQYQLSLGAHGAHAF